jgi:hypothetical protein
MADPALTAALRRAASHADPPARLAALVDEHHARVALRALSSLQDGQFATRQVSALGISTEAVRWLAASGRIASPRRGVWRWTTATGAPDPAVAAWLACWPHGTISHGSAAHHHGLGGAPARPEVVIAHGGPTRRPPGVRVHVSRALPRADRLVVGAVPYTTVARTVCDLATEADPIATLTLLDDAVAAGAAPRWVHQRACALADGRDGVALIRAATEPGASAELRSWLERTARYVFRTAGLPEAEWNAPVHDRRGLIGVVDALWRIGETVVVSETEGLRFHTTPRARARDARRFNRLGEAGCIVRRHSWHDVVQRPVEVATTVARALIAAGAAVDLSRIPSHIEVPTRATFGGR